MLFFQLSLIVFICTYFSWLEGENASPHPLPKSATVLLADALTILRVIKCIYNWNGNCNSSAFTKLSLAKNSRGNFRSLNQAAACQMSTLGSFIIIRLRGFISSRLMLTSSSKQLKPIFIDCGLNHVGIAPQSTISVDRSRRSFQSLVY